MKVREQALWREALSRRAIECAGLCAELDRIDRTQSPISRERDYLSTRLEELMLETDAGNVRMPTALRLIDLLLTLLEECCIERKAQLERSARS